MFSSDVFFNFNSHLIILLSLPNVKDNWNHVDRFLRAGVVAINRATWVPVYHLVGQAKSYIENVLCTVSDSQKCEYLNEHMGIC